MLEKIKKQKNASIVAFVAFLVSLLVCTSIFLPKNIGNVLTLSDLPVEKLTISQIESQRSCVLERSGRYTITGENPQIVFSCTKRAIESLRINVETQLVQNINFKVYTAYEDGVFSDERCYNDTVFAGKNSVVVDLPVGEYSFIRIDIETNDVYFKSIEVFDKQPSVVPYNPERSFGDYVKALLLPVAIAWLAWSIEKRTNTLDAIIKFIIKNKYKIAKVAVFFLVAVLSAVMLEMIIGTLLLRDGFNKYRCVFLSGIAELICIFIFTRKSIVSKVENVFLPVALVLGLVIFFATPIVNFSWNQGEQFGKAVEMSYLGKVYFSAAEQEVIDNADGELLTVRTNETGDVIWDNEEYKSKTTRLEELDNIVASEKNASFSIAHLPSGIVMAVARNFNLGFVTRYNLGRFANLILYVFVCYFAIKKIKSGKMILATIALFPTSLFMAANYVYDSWTIAFSVLGTAYYLSILQQPQKIISINDTIIMSGAFALAVLQNPRYLPLLIIPLVMSKEWSGETEKKEYYNIIKIISSLVLLYFLIITLTKTGGADLLRSALADTKLQISVLLKNPIAFTKMIIRFLWNYLSPTKVKLYVSSFANLGTGKFALLLVLMAAFTAFTDSNKKFKFKILPSVKMTIIGVFILTCILIGMGLQSNDTLLEPIEILSQHYKYIIPVLPPLLLVITGSRWEAIKIKNKYNSLVLYITSALVMLDIYSGIISKMV